MKPILFNGDMVRAILDGRKTVTRRPISPRYRDDEFGFNVCTNIATGERWVEKMDADEGDFEETRYVKAPYQPGDILYVRETWCDDAGLYRYKTTTPDNLQKHFKWRPSIHMPKEAARMFLKVTGVRVERLQEMKIYDAEDEGCLACIGLSSCGGGCDSCPSNDPVGWFRRAWDSIYSSRGYGWEQNPWVWVIEFERTERGEQND